MFCLCSVFYFPLNEPRTKVLFIFVVFFLFITFLIDSSSLAIFLSGLCPRSFDFSQFIPTFWPHADVEIQSLALLYCVVRLRVPVLYFSDSQHQGTLICRFQRFIMSMWRIDYPAFGKIAGSLSYDFWNTPYLWPSSMLPRVDLKLRVDSKGSKTPTTRLEHWLCIHL